MIKVQPSSSRLLKEETADRLTLTRPRPGLFSIYGFLVLGSIAVLGGAVWGQTRVSDLIVRIGLVGMFVLPGVLLLLWALGRSRRGWSLDRSATRVTFTRRGLFGSRVRWWPAEDVTSFWVEEIPTRPVSQHILIVGFRNGRSEDLLSDPDGEDLRWAAAMLKDRRGNRPPATNTGRAIAEPVARKVDPSVVPVSLVTRRFPSGGVELAFLPLLNFRRRRWKLLGAGLLWLAGILLLSAFLLWLPGSSYPGWMTRVAVAVVLLTLAGRVMVLTRTAVVLIEDGIVRIVQNQHQGNHEFPVDEIEFVQTYRAAGKTELQFLRKGKPKLRLLEGRPGDELEWAARFLRVAIKHREEEEVAPLAVNASAGECQVCSEKMETRVVFCGKCRTPHHEECWSYVGTCSTYGCREIRFTRA